MLCGCGSDTEVRVNSRDRLDCLNLNNFTCGEVEFNRRRMPRDVGKLSTAKSSGRCDNPILAVKPADYAYASRLARVKGIQVVEANNWSLAMRKVSCGFDFKRIRLT